MAEVSTISTAWAVFSAIGGSLIGAVIGGATSYFLQRKSLKATKAQHDEDRFEVRKALGYSLLFKTIRLASDLNSLGKAVRQTLDAARKSGFKGSAFQVVMPIVPLPDPVKFSPEEMALVLSLDSKLFNQLGALDELHNSTVALFDLYGSKRNSVTDHFGATMVEGNLGTITLTEQQKNWLAPRATELNLLVDMMLSRTEQDGKEAWDALGSLHATLEREFKLKHKLERRSE